MLCEGRFWPPLLATIAILPAACGHDSTPLGASAVATPAHPVGASAATSTQQPTIAPPMRLCLPRKRAASMAPLAYDYTAKLVAFGPRPPASDAIQRTQDYIIGQLKSFGCAVDTDDFHAETPIGSLAMKNIIAKVPGTGQGIILLLTHYDTLRLDNFVGRTTEDRPAG